MIIEGITGKIALKNHVPQEELPAKLIIIYYTEFDFFVRHASEVNFKNAQKKFMSNGYQLPQIVFGYVACSPSLKTSKVSH